MNTITATGQLYGETVTVRRITKKEARALFAAGITIYLQSCNMHPFGVWQSLCPIELDRERINSAYESMKFCEKNNLPVSECSELTPEIQFNNMVNEFEYYNTDNERGKYAAYYIKSSN